MKNMIFLAVWAALLTIGCPPPAESDESIVEETFPVDISFPEDSVTLWKNTSLRLTVNVVTQASEKGCTVTSSDENIVKTTVLDSGEIVLTAADTAGSVTVTAVSKADPAAAAVCTVTVPDGVQEVVHRNGKGYRLAALFDFSETGTDGTWAKGLKESQSSNLVYSVDAQKGVLTVQTPSGEDFGDITYSLELSGAAFAEGLPSGKTVSYAEIAASIDGEPVSGLGMGLGSYPADADSAYDNFRGWANEVIVGTEGDESSPAEWQTRIGCVRNRFPIEIVSGETYVFGLLFEPSRLISYCDAVETSRQPSVNADGYDYSIPGQDTYYLYFEKERWNETSQQAAVTVDYAAFYYNDESIIVEPLL